MNTFQRIFLVPLVATYATSVFVQDLDTPLGIEAWVLNVPLVILPVFFRSVRMTVFLGLASSAMLVVGGISSPSGTIRICGTF